MLTVLWWGHSHRHSAFSKSNKHGQCLSNWSKSKITFTSRVLRYIRLFIQLLAAIIIIFPVAFDPSARRVNKSAFYVEKSSLPMPSLNNYFVFFIPFRCWSIICRMHLHAHFGYQCFGCRTVWLQKQIKGIKLIRAISNIQCVAARTKNQHTYAKHGIPSILCSLLFSLTSHLTIHAHMRTLLLHPESPVANQQH